MKYNLIDSEDPTREWVIDIEEDGKVTSLKEESQEEEEKPEILMDLVKKVMEKNK